MRIGTAATAGLSAPTFVAAARMRTAGRGLRSVRRTGTPVVPRVLPRAAARLAVRRAADIVRATTIVVAVVLRRARLPGTVAAIVGRSSIVAPMALRRAVLPGAVTAFAIRRRSSRIRRIAALACRCRAARLVATRVVVRRDRPAEIRRAIGIARVAGPGVTGAVALAAAIALTGLKAAAAVPTASPAGTAGAVRPDAIAPRVARRIAARRGTERRSAVAVAVPAGVGSACAS